MTRLTWNSRVEQSSNGTAGHYLKTQRWRDPSARLSSALDVVANVWLSISLRVNWWPIFSTSSLVQPLFCWAQLSASLGRSFSVNAYNPRGLKWCHRPADSGSARFYQHLVATLALFLSPNKIFPKAEGTMRDFVYSGVRSVLPRWTCFTPFNIQIEAAEAAATILNNIDCSPFPRKMDSLGWQIIQKTRSDRRLANCGPSAIFRVGEGSGPNSKDNRSQW